ncbi:hypothetical protein EDD18DRAFT_1103311 [Armillaria luteobubalina]|uniref:Uncharacterized protein n=1 Tax=Armillaria luteobubalina TaxID=153913 RepID=A0AA39QBU4_9AGAR|nr:hypothetical protein EDD18DRAFT_1103311 [Armillaria luteobubalina]
MFHPSSTRLTQIVHFEDYQSSSAFQHAKPPIDTHPWRPFASRCDFELAEFILNAALTEKQMKTLFSLLNPEESSNPSTEFNICTPKDFKEHWDHAVNLITPFEKSTVTVQLQNKDYTYDVYRWNLWEWALELIRNPLLEPHFIWDAIQLLKWNRDAFEKFVDKPWTAQAFWDLQMVLPGGAKVLCYIIYADKTRLSSFGTAQAYPVVARCGNLPVKIQNGNGIGGGHVVGWLPVIKEDTKFRKKVYYVDFKHRVNGLKPCVICLVPKLEQYNLDIRYELWTKHQTQEILADAAAIPTQGARNKFLSGFGLRHIELFPRWKNLYHFESGFMAVHFTDGTKYEDLSKCIRSYIELRMYAGFNLHTECSIQAIQDELLRFSELIRAANQKQEYEQLTRSTDPGTKLWNFPKVHSHQHMVDDILQKGVTRNYNMKPNEKMHGPLKDILRVDSWCNAASFIYQQINLHNEQLKNPDNDELEEETSESEVSDYSDKFEKYPDIIPEVDGEKISFKSFKPDEKIQLHGLLKVNYENMVDWTTSTDYLRCSPDFYNHP